MAHYLLQVSYTAEAWAALVRQPQNRLDAVRPVVDRLGGSLDTAWLSFGEYDIVALLQMPDNVSAAAFSMALSAAGACRKGGQDHPADDLRGRNRCYGESGHDRLQTSDR